MTVRPHLRLDIRMMNRQHTANAEEQGDEDSYRQPADHRTVPPVIPVAVVEQISHFEQQGSPKHGAQPVDSKER